MCCKRLLRATSLQIIPRYAPPIRGCLSLNSPLPYFMYEVLNLTYTDDGKEFIIGR